MRLYADDSKLLGRVKAIEHVNRVQISLNNPVTLADLWNMFYNFKKCHHPHIGNNFPETEYIMETPNGPIKVEKVDCEKDLGVMFDRNMKFGEHISSKVSKANQILGLIFRTFTYMDREIISHWSDHTSRTRRLYGRQYTKMISFKSRMFKDEPLGSSVT